MSRTTRRQFLSQTGSVAAAAFAAPWVVPSSCFGANERIVTGHIGVGGQGSSNLGAFLKLASPAAVCDVDKKRLAAAVERVEKETQKTCEGVGDYRKLLDRKDIDVIVISTPDHWHALTTIHACQAGKDVYCEKPLSLTILEGRKMVEAARKHERIVQTGSQQRSDARFRQACELVRNGRIGKLERVMVGLPGSNFDGPPVPDSDPPEELDYDMWLGPAPQRPYNKNRVHYKFRFFWDYSGGQMTNFGAPHRHRAVGLGHGQLRPGLDRRDRQVSSRTMVRGHASVPSDSHLCQRSHSGRRPRGEGLPRRCDVRRQRGDDLRRSRQDQEHARRHRQTADDRQR